MTASTVNGRPPRKQLSEQLDRLDGIIESLADGLPDAVRHALRAHMSDAEPAAEAVNTVPRATAKPSGGAESLGNIANVANELWRSPSVVTAVAAMSRVKSAVLLGTAAGVVVAAVTSSVSPFAAVWIGASAAGVAAAVAGRRGTGSTAA